MKMIYLKNLYYYIKPNMFRNLNIWFFSSLVISNSSNVLISFDFSVTKLEELSSIVNSFDDEIDLF